MDSTQDFSSPTAAATKTTLNKELRLPHTSLFTTRMTMWCSHGTSVNSDFFVLIFYTNFASPKKIDQRGFGMTSYISSSCQYARTKEGRRGPRSDGIR